MKTSLCGRVLIWAAYCSLSPLCFAAGVTEATSSPTPPGSLLVNTEVFAIGLPTYKAIDFGYEHDLAADPVKAVADLGRLIQSKDATKLIDLSISSQSGQRGTSKSSHADLEVEPTWDSAPDDMVQLYIAFHYENESLTTGITARAGELRFLGSFDPNGGKDQQTCFVFCRVHASVPTPPVWDLFQIKLSLDKNVNPDFSRMGLIPVIATLTNKNKTFARVLTINGYCAMTVYAINPDGSKTHLFSCDSGTINHDPNEVDALIEMEPGRSLDFKSVLPNDVSNKGRKMVFIMTVLGSDWEPVYRVASAPFVISDLKYDPATQADMQEFKPHFSPRTGP
jgi:hypothetical protein